MYADNIDKAGSAQSFMCASGLVHVLHVLHVPWPVQGECFELGHTSHPLLLCKLSPICAQAHDNRNQPVSSVVIQFDITIPRNHAPLVCVGFGGHTHVVGTILVWLLPSLRLRLSGTTHHRMIVPSLSVIITCTGWPICSQTRLCSHKFRLILRLSCDATDVNIT